jgi:hypothetical protein
MNIVDPVDVAINGNIMTLNETKHVARSSPSALMTYDQLTLLIPSNQTKTPLYYLTDSGRGKASLLRFEEEAKPTVGIDHGSRSVV